MLKRILDYNQFEKIPKLCSLLPGDGAAPKPWGNDYPDFRGKNDNVPVEK